MNKKRVVRHVCHRCVESHRWRTTALYRR